MVLVNHLSAEEEKARLRAAEEEKASGSGSATQQQQQIPTEAPPPYTEREVEAPIPVSSHDGSTTTSVSRQLDPTDARRPLSSSSSSSSLSTASTPSTASTSGSLPPIPNVQELPPPSTQPSHLSKPIAIPTVNATLDAPFLRAYPPILQTYNVPQQVFLNLLDGLNKRKRGAPPLTLLSAAAGIVGFVPSSTAQIVSGSVQAGTSLAHAAISTGGTELYLRHLNHEIFEPRGLKVEIAKLDALAKIVGFPDEYLDDRGKKVDKNAQILAPLDDGDVDAAKTQSAAQRRVDALSQYIQDLEVVPMTDADKAKLNPLTKFNSALSERKEAKKERRVTKRRVKRAEKSDPDNIRRKLEEEMAKLDVKEREVVEKIERKGKKDRKLDEELRKIERKRANEERKYEKRMWKKDHPKKTGKVDKREERQVRKVHWLIIRDLDADSGKGENPVT